jgi:hypothetical protein
VQLRQAEPVGVFDHHDGGVGHIHPHLDHRGRDQQGDPAVGEIGHHRFALGARHLAVGETDLDLKDAAQILGPGFGGGEVRGLALGHQGTDPVGLGAALDGRLQPFGDLADARARQDGGGDRGAARRLLHQPADLELAVLGQLQRARDRRRRHGQQMDAADARIALGLKPLALIDPEPVLFVDDRQAQPVEPHGVLEQGVGADGDPGAAGGQGVQPFASLRRRIAAGQEDGGDARTLQHRRKALIMLTGENLGRGHQRRLQAAGRRVGHGQRRDRGLARADIALQQPSHLFARGHVEANFGQSLRLGVRQSEGQGGRAGRRRPHRGGSLAQCVILRARRRRASASWWANSSS